MYITRVPTAPGYPLPDREVGQNLAFKQKSGPWAVQGITVGQWDPDRVDFFCLPDLDPSTKVSTEVRRLWAMFAMPFLGGLKAVARKPPICSR